MRGRAPGLPLKGSIGQSIPVSEHDNFVDDSAHFTNSVTSEEIFFVTEAAAFTNSVQANATFINSVVDSSATFTNATTTVIPTTLADSSGAFTNATSLVVESNLVESAALSNATVNTIANLQNLVVESAAFTDEQSVGPVTLVVESATIADIIPLPTTITNLIVETAAFTDAQVTLNTATTTVIESGVFTDAYLTQLTAYSNVLESMFASSTTQGGGAPGAWTANLESFAMSRYTNYPFNSMAVVDGVLVGISDDGVFRLDAADDDGVAIDAEVAHDWSDKVPGKQGMVTAPQFKLPRSLYLTGTTDGQMAVDLGYVDDDGTETDASYDIPNRTQDGFITNRVPLGRGIRSRFLQPTIKNVSGSAFTVTEAKIEVDLSKRSM